MATLKTGDIHRSPDGTTIINLAGNPVPIHEPFATLIGQLPDRRSNGVSDQLNAEWLFPGRHAGGHVGPVVLGNGSEPSASKLSGCATALERSLPPRSRRPCSELIGVNANTAPRWAALSSGNWTAYAAELASRDELRGRLLPRSGWSRTVRGFIDALDQDEQAALENQIDRWWAVSAVLWQRCDRFDNLAADCDVIDVNGNLRTPLGSPRPSVDDERTSCMGARRLAPDVV